LEFLWSLDVGVWRFLFAGLPKIAASDTVQRMSEIELIVEELKSLPPAKVVEAAGYIHHLKAASEAERRAALEKTAGALTPAEADEMARLIEEGCEQVEQREW
jgi:hypothetical protein